MAQNSDVETPEELAALRRRVDELTAEAASLYDRAPCGYHSLAPDGTFRRINDTELSWLGYERAEVLGKSFGDFMTPAGRLAFERITAHCVIPSSDEEIGTFEYEVVRKDGGTRSLRATVRADRDEEGRCLGTRATLLDMTAREQAEQALHERESILQDFLDSSSDLVQSTRVDGRFEYVNRAWRETLGYTTTEARELGIFDVVDPEHHAEWREVQETLLSGRRPPIVETVFRTKTGRQILVEGHVSLRLEKDTSPTTRGFFRDVTLRRDADAALRRSRDELSLANAALERANRAKDEFLASMSHELRTPLNAVLGLSEALQEDAYGALGDSQRKAVRRIEESGRHLLALINDILDLSKIEAGKMVLELRLMSVDDVCRASLRMIQETAHKKQINVSYKVEPGIGAIHADERRLKQILVNLLSNAVKFTPSGGTVGLDVAPEEPSEGVRFTVWDTGIGIDSADLSRLFRPFVQLDSSLARQHAGTGLGLALVRRLCDLHGGGLTVESEPGRGSRFSVVLPGVRGALSHPDLLDSPRSSRRSIKNALIIEEPGPYAEKLTRYLGELGVFVVAETGGGDVVGRALLERAQVVFVDLSPPAVDGRAILRQLKDDERTARIPVVAVTSPLVPEELRALQADQWLAQPVSREKLRSVLARAATGKPESGTRGSIRPVEAMRVLVAEDDETNVTVVVDFLEARGYDIHVARNGREAINLAHDLQPDLILMDIQMPVVDGLTAIREIRATMGGTMPIIAVTALAMTGDRERCLEAGASDYLSKPIGLKRLAEMIQEHLRRRGAQDREGAGNEE